jgi:hypothetical protein
MELSLSWESNPTVYSINVCTGLHTHTHTHIHIHYLLRHRKEKHYKRHHEYVTNGNNETISVL